MSSRTPRVGLSIAPHEGFRAAASPLFAAGIVDVVEWSFDAGFAGTPEWVDAVCDVYSNARCLYGHGVTYSTLAALREKRQDRWLEMLGRELKRRHYNHISEHFGFMSAAGFRPSAPLPVPMTEGSLRVGREAVARLADVVGSPVGLENLAPVLSPRDADEQGEFLEALLAPIDGFLLLDLHNVYCQSQCLGIPIETLIDDLPLERVREIHVSGGREWHPPTNPGRSLWCDSHDEPVPQPVFDIIPYALQRCPNVEAVFFERINDTLDAPDAVASYRRDYKKLRAIVATASGSTRGRSGRRDRFEVLHG